MSNNASRTVVRKLQTARFYETDRTPGLPLETYRKRREWAKQLRQEAKNLYDSETAKAQHERKSNRATA